MKTAIVITLLMAHAANAEITAGHIDTCEKWGTFAHLAMQANQDRKPLAEQMRLSPDPRAYEITIEAYQTPRAYSSAPKELAASDFRDEITSDCIASLSGKGGKRPAEFWQIKQSPRP